MHLPVALQNSGATTKLVSLREIGATKETAGPAYASASPLPFRRVCEHACPPHCQSLRSGVQMCVLFLWLSEISWQNTDLGCCLKKTLARAVLAGATADGSKVWELQCACQSTKPSSP